MFPAPTAARTFARATSAPLSDTALAKPHHDHQLVALGGEREYPVMPERSVSLAWFKRPSPACWRLSAGLLFRSGLALSTRAKKDSMARLWLDEPLKTGYESVLIQIELGATDKTQKARLVAAGHNYEVKASVGLHFAWVPLALAEAQTKLHLEVELGRGQWVKVGPVYRLARGDEDTTQALTLIEL